MPFARQQPAQAPIAEAPALRRQLPQTFAYGIIVGPAPLIGQRRMADAHQPASAPLAQSVTFHQPANR